MKLTSNCRTCGKPLNLTSEIRMSDTEVLRSYKCGHSFVETESATSADGLQPRSQNFSACIGPKEAYDYQKEGVDFIAKTGYNCLIADPMGLGKTIQALLAARNAEREDGTPRFKTILVVVKPNTMYQWHEESKEWFDSGLWSCYMIKNSKEFVPPGFRLYIVSMDQLRNKRIAETLKGLQIDLVVVDECHSFKNPDSARSQALVAFLQGLGELEIERQITLVCNFCKQVPHCASCGKHGDFADGLCDICAETHAENEALSIPSEIWDGTWTESAKIRLNLRTDNSQNISYLHRSKCPKCGTGVAIRQDRIVLDETERARKGLILLSGTPIKNRANEYFIPLNLLRPDIFTSFRAFEKRWLQQDPQSGKYTRIHPYMMDEFQRITSKFILRRNKNEVLSLPPFRRTFETIEIEDPAIKSLYNKEIAELAARTEGGNRNLRYLELQEHLMTLRRIIGVAKVPFATEYVESFLEQEDTEKIAIGIQHDAVRDGLYYALTAKGHKVLKYSGEDSIDQKRRTERLFKEDPTCRVIIINMIAGGVGLNLQVCNNVLTLERLWNAADEEQFEGRFWRNGQTLPVQNEVMQANGTLDTLYFLGMIEYKRQTCAETLDWNLATDPNAIRHLVADLIGNKL